MEQQHQEDQYLWRVARRRVAFKNHLAIYIITNLLLWLLWWLADRHTSGEGEYSAIPWPVFPTLGWGLGVLMNYLGAYVFYGRRSLVQREYDKLKRR